MATETLNIFTASGLQSCMHVEDFTLHIIILINNDRELNRLPIHFKDLSGYIGKSVSLIKSTLGRHYPYKAQQLLLTQMSTSPAAILHMTDLPPAIPCGQCLAA